MLIERPAPFFVIAWRATTIGGRCSKCGVQAKSRRKLGPLTFPEVGAAICLAVPDVRTSIWAYPLHVTVHAAGFGRSTCGVNPFESWERIRQVKDVDICFLRSLRLPAICSHFRTFSHTLFFLPSLPVIMVGTKAWHRVKEDLRTDYTWNRVGRYSVRAARRLPTGTAHYVIDKVPMMGWLPKYNPRWLLNDFIAGLTLGLMLIPQGLAYAKIATIPVDYGLQSSWLPAAIYAVMGSTKGKPYNDIQIISTLKITRRSFHRTYFPHRSNDR